MCNFAQESGERHRGGHQQDGERHQESHQEVRGQHLQEDGGHPDVSVAGRGAGHRVPEQPGGPGPDIWPPEGAA